MRKLFTSFLAGILIVLSFALFACDNDKNGTYYPTNEEMKANLESNGYFVEAYHDYYVFDLDNGYTDKYSAETIRAKQDVGNYLHFYRVDKPEACDYYYKKLREEYPDAEMFVLMENDEKFGNIVYCGTKIAVDAAGIKVVDVKVKV